MPKATGVHARTRQGADRFSGRVDDIKHLVAAAIDSLLIHLPILHGSLQPGTFLRREVTHASPLDPRRFVCCESVKNEAACVRGYVVEHPVD